MNADSQLQTVVGHLADSGSAEFIHQLSANDKSWLLTYMAEVDPDLVAEAVGRLIEWHAATPARRKRMNQEKYRARRRLQRRAAAVERIRASRAGLGQPRGGETTWGA